ncbi:MAG: hypothetical protein JWO60_2393 [Frankiales bacterium]|nr:hypothetical protein [Frankiales bacterium]
MQFSFTGRVVEWRGPAPFYYVEVPEQESAEIAELSASVSYGWGAVPVEARIGTADLSTSLFPKDGRYLLPLRAAVRTAQGIDVDDEVAVQMRLGRG